MMKYVLMWVYSEEPGELVALGIYNTFEDATKEMKNNYAMMKGEAEDEYEFVYACLFDDSATIETPRGVQHWKIDTV